MNKFILNMVCKKCGNSNIRICKHIDFTGGLDEASDYTGDIVLICRDENCSNKELINIEYEILY